MGGGVGGIGLAGSRGGGIGSAGGGVSGIGRYGGVGGHGGAGRIGGGLDGHGDEEKAINLRPKPGLAAQGVWLCEEVGVRLGADEGGEGGDGVHAGGLGGEDAVLCGCHCVFLDGGGGVAGVVVGRGDLEVGVRKVWERGERGERGWGGEGEGEC